MTKTSRFSLGALIIVAFAAAGPVRAQWSFDGIPPALLDALRRDLAAGLLEGPANPAAADELIRRLMAKDQFESVSVFVDEGGYKVVAQTLRTIRRVSFTGNRKLRTGDISSAVDLQVNQQFERKKVLEAGEKLKDYYGRRGFFNTVIQVNFKTPSPTDIEIEFVIDENKPCLIEQIVFETPNILLRGQLEEKAKPFLRRTFTEDLTSSLEGRVRSLFRSQRYLRAKLVQSRVAYNPDRTRAMLVYEVQEPFRYQVLHQGQEKFDTSDILRALALDSYEQAAIDPSAELASKLRARYMAKGYAHAQVVPEETEIPATWTRRLKLNITEGPRVKIEKIEVTGRISRSSAYYADFIENNSSDLIGAGYFNREDLEIGYRNLVTHLKNLGYLRARLQSARIEYLGQDRSKVLILIVMDEGPLTQVRRITFNNAKAFSNLELMQAINLQPNAPLRLNELEEALAKLKDYYHSKGYLEMKILNEDESLVQYNPTGTQANINFDIYEGPRLVVSSIALDGNTFTKDYVILREIDFEIGDILTSERVNTSITRLNRLGLFSRAEIRTLEAGTNISERTVVISVSERYPGLFRIGAGVNNERDLQFRGYTSVSYNNLWGTARAITGRFEARENPNLVEGSEYNFNAGYLEPFLFNTRTRGRTNFIFFRDLGPQAESIQEGLQVDLLLERDLTNHTKLTWTLWSLNSRRATVLRPTGTQDSPENQQVALIGPALDIDYRDSPFLPTQGTYTRLNFFYSDPNFGSSDPVKFYRTEGSFTHYLKVFSPRIVWANQIRGGYLKNVSDLEDSGVPASQAFFLGGYSTIRGFGGLGAYEIIPNRREVRVQSGTDLIVPDDSSYYLLKTELRFPLYDPFSLGGVIFYDAGEVAIRGLSLDQPFKQAIGVGLRVNTPVGPVVVDWAFKVNPVPQERDNRIHLSIGTF